MSFVVKFSVAAKADDTTLIMPILEPEARDRDDLTSGFFQKLSDLAQVARLHLCAKDRYVFTGRIRLDRRWELSSELERKLGAIGRAATDADLCLRAYAVWGDAALEHLHGDFSFVIWDERRRKLLCARDRLGVRPLAYLQRGATWWISDSLEELISRSRHDRCNLDKAWISDFLATGVCDDTARTAYADVKRLPPAHILTIAPVQASIKRYWHLQIGEPLLLKSASEYVERFHDLLNASIRDRMPRGTVGIMMSGGLDSTTLAAKAVEISGGADRVFAETWLVNFPQDPEAASSRLVAERLGIRHNLVDCDPMRYDPEWRNRPAKSAEPSLTVTHPVGRGYEFRRMAQTATVWFYGEGPDNALTFEWQEYLMWLMRRGMFTPLAHAIVEYLSTKSWKEWKSTLGVWARKAPSSSASSSRPEWIRHFHCGADAHNDSAARSWRPRAFESFKDPIWPSFLEGLDEDSNSAIIDWRHPYLDLEFLHFMLQVPPVPWARRKRLIRRSMQGRLPREILKRDKLPLVFDPVTEFLRVNPPAPPKTGSIIEDYVNIDYLPNTGTHDADLYAVLRVSILDHWLSTRYV